MGREGNRSLCGQGSRARHVISYFEDSRIRGFKCLED